MDKDVREKSTQIDELKAELEKTKQEFLKRYETIVLQKKRLEEDANKSVGNITNLQDEHQRVKLELQTHKDALTKLDSDYAEYRKVNPAAKSLIHPPGFNKRGSRVVTPPPGFHQNGHKREMSELLDEIEILKVEKRSLEEVNEMTQKTIQQLKYELDIMRADTVHMSVNDLNQQELRHLTVQLEAQMSISARATQERDEYQVKCINSQDKLVIVQKEVDRLQAACKNLHAVMNEVALLKATINTFRDTERNNGADMMDLKAQLHEEHENYNRQVEANNLLRREMGQKKFRLESYHQMKSEISKTAFEEAEVMKKALNAKEILITRVRVLDGFLTC